MRRGWLVLFTVAVCALAATPAEGTFRGANGKLAHIYNDNGNVEILTVNPDGSARTNITNNPGRDEQPKWSPDGSKIAFVSDRAGNKDIWVMNADGSGPSPLTTDPASDTVPVWSPDGTKIVFSSNRSGHVELWIMNADGSGETQLTDGPGTVRSASWSPDSARIAFERTQLGTVPDSDNVYTIGSDGSGLTLLTPEPAHTNDSYPAWSPDGSMIAFEYRYDSWGDEIWRMSMDGTNKARVYFTIGTALRSWEPAGLRLLLHPLTTLDHDGTDRRDWTRNHSLPPDGDTFYVWASEIWSPDGRLLAGSRQVCFNDDIPCAGSQIFVLDMETDTLVELGRGTLPDWQPVPVNAYARPKAASPVQVSLVPAYESCVPYGNRTHGPPLAYGSCNPPQQTSGLLTVGTPDANGLTAKSASYIRVGVRVGVPSTPEDEADVHMRGTITDVRNASDLSDYTGDLAIRLTAQITDKNNSPQPGAATVQEFTHLHPVSCAATADPTVGATCQFQTTVEALVPGALTEQKRAIWQLGQVEIDDANGDAFLKQGVFVP